MRSTITILLAAPLALAACTLDESESVGEDDAALVDASVDEAESNDDRLPSGVAAALPPGCMPWANQPAWDGGGTVLGSGGWYGCPSTSWGKVLLRQDKPWLPDVTLDEASGTGGSFTAQLSEICYYSGSGMKVYVETRYGSGYKVQSARAVVPCTAP